MTTWTSDDVLNHAEPAVKALPRWLFLPLARTMMLTQKKTLDSEPSTKLLHGTPLALDELR